MWLFHEHCSFTSAVDKYWIFEEREQLKKFVNIFTQSLNLDLLDQEYYQEIYSELEENISFEQFLSKQITNLSEIKQLYMTNDNYIVITEIINGFGRRQ